MEKNQMKQGMQGNGATENAESMDVMQTAKKLWLAARQNGTLEALMGLSFLVRRPSLRGIAWLASGVAVGAGLGMLLAPSAGNELRAKVREKYKHFSKSIGSELETKNPNEGSLGSKMIS